MKPFLLLTSLIILSACSEKQVYQSGDGWRQLECSKILDEKQRNRCYEHANRRYEDYKALQNEQK